MSQKDKNIEKVDIENPWLVVHQPGGNGEEMITIFGGMEGATFEHFGIIIADVIQQCAAHFEVDIQQVLNEISDELTAPTTELVHHKIQ